MADGAAQLVWITGAADVRLHVPVDNLTN